MPNRNSSESTRTGNGARVLYYDILNILAILAVLALHHNGIVHSYRAGRAWKESLVVECVFYWAVPVFIMLSGATLMQYRKRYSTAAFFKKRILRTVVPFLLWSLIMLLWKTQTGALDLTGKSFRDVCNMIGTYQIETSYYFFGVLFACYLAIPVFSLLTDNRQILWYITAINFLFASVRPVLKTWLNFEWSLDIAVVGGLAIYLLLGYLISTTDLKKPTRLLIYAAGIAGCALRFIYTYVRSIRAGATDTSIKGYPMFHAVFLTLAVFVFVRQIPWETILSPRVKKAAAWLSARSFGIFLVHKIVLYYELEFTHLKNTSFIWRILMIPVTYVISLAVVTVLKKIPVIGKVICG